MRLKQLLSCVVIIVLLVSAGSAHAEEDIGSVGAKAAIVMDAVTGRILYSQNADVKLPVASTTKIMTSLIALEQQDIYAVFEVDEKAIRVEGSSMGLQTGDKATLYALAQGMLLASGNDGANAAAVRIAGSMPAFARQMNDRALEIGMTNTSFETPSGLDSENHYSTAYDMALLTRQALRNIDFANISSQYRMKVTFGNPPYDRWLTNHNKLLNYYEPAIGVKTGFTKKAGRCLVSAAKRDGITLICVTLNCPDDWDVHERLFEQCFPLQQVEDLSRDFALPRIPVVGGTRTDIRAAKYEDAIFPIPAEGAKIEYVVRAPAFMYAPIRSGQSVGSMDILLDSQLLATLTLISGEDVPLLHPYKEEKGFLEGLGDFFAGLF